MRILRLCEILIKLTLCLPFKGKYAIPRVVFFPLHLLFLPHFVFLKQSKRVKNILESLGVVFIKLGQSLSLKSFLLEKELLEALSHLQDAVRPSKLNIHAHLAGNAILQNKGFWVEVDPISSASVAQVYRGAILHQGTQQMIAIKVVKKNVEKDIERDFGIIFPLVKMAGMLLSPALQIVNVAKDIHASLQKEVNLINEAQNITVVKRNIAVDANVTVPQVFSEYCNKTTLVMTFLDGISLRSVIHGKCNINRKTVARNVVMAYLNQVYRDGIFHADMHSGNILANQDASISLLDFGIIASISKQDRRAVATMIYAFLHSNHELVISVQLEAGYITNEIFFNNEYRFAMMKLAEGFGQTFEMSAFTKDLFLIMHRFNVFVPKHLLLLNKTIMYVEDVTKQLDKNFRPFDVISPWIKKWYYKERILMFAERIFKI